LKRRADAPRRGPIAAAIVRRAVAASVDRLARHESAALGRGVEGVHQARVAIRRLRSDLRSFRDLVDARWSGSLRQELRWLGGELGAVRDLDVFIMRVTAAAKRAGANKDPGVAELLHAARAARAQARKRLVKSMRSDRYAKLRDRLVQAASAPSFTLASRLPAHDAFGPIIRRRMKRVRSAVDDLAPRPSMAALHRIRILAKRLRYAAEAIGPEAGEAVGAVARAAEALQDALGVLNDADAACRRLRRTRRDPRVAFAANALLALERDAVMRARADWRSVWQRLGAMEPPSCR